MGSIAKRSGGYRAQVAVKGLRETATFSTKSEASHWIAEREHILRKQISTGINTDKTCNDAFERYLNEISIHKRGARWESIRLNAIAHHTIGKAALGDLKLTDLNVTTMAQWRDLRLKTVSGSTVNREMNLLSNVFNVARREWKWIAESPTIDVRRPKESAPRDRRVSDDEIERICLALDYDGAVKTKSSAVAAAFLFAIETAMRAGEICELTWANINDSVAHLPMTKNGSKRDVPLTPRAIEILNTLPRDEPTCFGLTPASLDTLFRKGKTRAMIEDLRFHDTRHEAITRLAKKLNVLDLARMVGHKDLRMLQVYYNETAKEIAAKLASGAAPN